MDNHVFIIDQLTGVLQTNETYARFADGYFEISVKAMNAPDKNDLMKIKVNSGFILRITQFKWLLMLILMITGGYVKDKGQLIKYCTVSYSTLTN